MKVVVAEDEVVVNVSVKAERGHVCCRPTQINSLRHTDSHSYPRNFAIYSYGDDLQILQGLAYWGIETGDRCFKK